jgi:hypothetical protein
MLVIEDSKLDMIYYGQFNMVINNFNAPRAISTVAQEIIEAHLRSYEFAGPPLRRMELKKHTPITDKLYINPTFDYLIGERTPVMVIETPIETTLARPMCALHAQMIATGAPNAVLIQLTPYLSTMVSKVEIITLNPDIWAAIMVGIHKFVEYYERVQGTRQYLRSPNTQYKYIPELVPPMILTGNIQIDTMNKGIYLPPGTTYEDLPSILNVPNYNDALVIYSYLLSTTENCAPLFCNRCKKYIMGPCLTCYVIP